MDKFQERYLEHQENKLNRISNNKAIDYTTKDMKSLLRIMKNRRSQRKFNHIEIGNLSFIDEAIKISPSSCNRKAIYYLPCDGEVAEQFLVGGKNWLKYADKVILLFGNKKAYKSPNEIGFMPYLDAGFVAQSIYLLSEVLSIGCCFINPNIKDKEEFEQMFGNDYFCGAVALGYYDKKAKEPPKL